MAEGLIAEKKNICAGLLAHVDAGKTTLSEAMLYLSGEKKSWAGWTTGTASWTPTAWSGSGA